MMKKIMTIYWVCSLMIGLIACSKKEPERKIDYDFSIVMGYSCVIINCESGRIIRRCYDNWDTIYNFKIKCDSIYKLLSKSKIYRENRGSVSLHDSIVGGPTFMIIYKEDFVTKEIEIHSLKSYDSIAKIDSNLYKIYLYIQPVRLTGCRLPPI